MITTKITTTITRKITQTITGAGGVARRWLLNWGGVDQYATHSAWSMSGFGDKIEFSFVADAPGTGDDYLLDSTDGENYLKVANTTAVLTLGFLDTDDSTSRTVTGPTVVAGTTYAGYVVFKADGVDLVVNGTTYDSANVPAIKDDLTHIAAETTPGSYFDGVIHYLRYVNEDGSDSRNYRMKDGPDALFLEDANNPLGPELVGTFTAAGDVVVTPGAGFTTVVNPTAGNWFTNYANTQASLVTGRRYLVSGRFRNTSGSADGFRITENANIVYTAGATTVDEWNDLSVIYTATINGTVRAFNNGFISTNDVDISVKCIETGAVLNNVDPEDWSR